MALQKAKFTEVPQDAIILSEDDALKYQLELLRKWHRPSDVYALKYGAPILGAASLFSGMYINSIFRLKFHLYNYGRMSSYLPTCCIPAAFSTALHAMVIMQDLVLQKTQCPACVEMRASAIQATLGFVYPMIMSPVACLSLSLRYGTYDIPNITQKPLEVLRLLQKMVTPSKNMLFALFVGHAVLGSVVTYLEAKALWKVNTELLEEEEKLDESKWTSGR